MRVAIAICLLFISTLCTAASREDKIQALMEAQGLLGMFEQQMAQGKAEARRQGGQMLDQMIASLNPPAEAQAKFRLASDRFIAAVQAPWSAREVVAVWAREYGAQFSDDELDRLLAFYTSPLGQKEARASEAAMPKVTAYFQQRYQPILQKATQDYVADLQRIARECCRK